MTPIDPSTPIAVTLEAQQWNIVLAGLAELPLKFSDVIDKKLKAQLYAATEATAAERAATPKSNGADHARDQAAQ